MTERDPLLQEREGSHGPFEITAHVAQSIKHITRRIHTAHQLNDRQNEALDMIATKIARIKSGNPNVKDHWDDIAGYAKLGAEACK